MTDRAVQRRTDPPSAPVRSRRTGPSPSRQELLEWVERVAMLFHNDSGLPPITGRIFGWLMVCDPPEQSGAEIAQAIGASRASITTNMRVLTAAGLVRRLTRPGERTAYYVVDDDAWERVIKRRHAVILSLAEITADGIALLGESSERAARVASANEMLEWFADLIATASPVPRPKRSRK